MRSKPRRWIGVDGEGVGRRPHRYVLLACSDGDYVESRSGLSTVDCLEFLLQLGTRDARVCGYYLTYDWTMMLRELDDRALYALFRPELRALSGGAFARVEYKHKRRSYQLHWLAGAMWVSEGKRKLTVWDLGKYYQGPFVGALRDWNIRPDVQADIARMKKRRSLFAWSDITRIRSYCLQECEALAEFGTKLEAAHTAADLKPRGWYGPGATASVLLKRHDIHERRGILPPALVDPVARAFIGGRSEISIAGEIKGPIDAYDISGAYPAQAAQLPCLEHGRWERVATERAITGAGVAHALVHGHVLYATGAWAPLPIRLPNARIVFPASGASGWWWRDEWLSARRGQWRRGLKFDYAYVLRKECNCRPFEWLPAVFERRLAVGKESGEGRVLKLGGNSVYGKLAQTIGSAQYASRAWAGMITSGTRAQVLDLMQRHKSLGSVLMIATDGMLSRETIDVGSEIKLGGWEHTHHKQLTLVRPGIYWLDGKLRARGLGRAALKAGRKKILAALAAGEESVALAKRTAFGGAGQKVLMHRESGAIARTDGYGRWNQIPSNVSLAPGPKRAPDWRPPFLDPHVESAPFGTKSTRDQGRLFAIMEAIRELVE